MKTFYYEIQLSIKGFLYNNGFIKFELDESGSIKGFGVLTNDVLIVENEDDEYISLVYYELDLESITYIESMKLIIEKEEFNIPDEFCFDAFEEDDDEESDEVIIAIENQIKQNEYKKLMDQRICEVIGVFEDGCY